MALGFTQTVTEMSTGRLLGVKRGRRVRRITSPPTITRLCRQCEILNISQAYRPPQPATGIALQFFSVLFIVCTVSFIVCVALCAVFCLSVVRYFV
jgi:hypothetical protein